MKRGEFLGDSFGPLWKSLKLIKAVIPSGNIALPNSEVPLKEEEKDSPLQSTDTPSGLETSPDAPPPVGWSPARIFFCAVLVSVTISFGSVYLYDRFIAQKVVAVDLQGFLAKQKGLYLQGDIDDAELKKRMDQLEQLVETIPKRYAVVLGDVVVRNIEVIEP